MGSTKGKFRWWQREVLEYLDGIEENLSKSTPMKARVHLDELRAAIPTLSDRAITLRFNRLLKSRPHFRGAYSRYARTKWRPVLDLLSRVQGTLKKLKAELAMRED